MHCVLLFFIGYAPICCFCSGLCQLKYGNELVKSMTSLLPFLVNPLEKEDFYRDLLLYIKSKINIY